MGNALLPAAQLSLQQQSLESIFVGSENCVAQDIVTDQQTGCDVQADIGFVGD